MPRSIEDPWRVIQCPGDGSGCQGEFTDDEFPASQRDALYYVRAIEAASPAVDANPLGCTYDEAGRCTKVNPCFGRPKEDECLSPIEERAWSSPIFVDQPRLSAPPKRLTTARARAPRGSPSWPGGIPLAATGWMHTCVTRVEMAVGCFRIAVTSPRRSCVVRRSEPPAAKSASPRAEMAPLALVVRQRC
jgi:hypothetical protein